MQKLTPADLRLVLSRTPREVMAMLQSYPVFVAGGFVRAVIAGEEVNDIDVFGHDKALLHSLAQSLATKRGLGLDPSIKMVHSTKNAYTVIAPPRLPVQFITRWLCDGPEPLLAQFDFTVCQAAFWFNNETWHSMCADGFYPDLAARRLTYTYPNREEDGAGSLLRAFKFSRKGYYIAPESIGGVVARLLGRVQVDPKHTLESLGERWLGACLGRLCEEVDPLKPIDGGAELSMEDIVF